MTYAENYRNARLDLGVVQYKTFSLGHTTVTELN